MELSRAKVNCPQKSKSVRSMDSMVCILDPTRMFINARELLEMVPTRFSHAPTLET